MHDNSKTFLKIDNNTFSMTNVHTDATPVTLDDTAPEACETSEDVLHGVIQIKKTDGTFINNGADDCNTYIDWSDNNLQFKYGNNNYIHITNDGYNLDSNAPSDTTQFVQRDSTNFIKQGVNYYEYDDLNRVTDTATAQCDRYVVHSNVDTVDGCDDGQRFMYGSSRFMYGSSLDLANAKSRCDTRSNCLGVYGSGSSFKTLYMASSALHRGDVFDNNDNPPNSVPADKASFRGGSATVHLKRDVSYNQSSDSDLHKHSCEFQKYDNRRPLDGCLKGQLFAYGSYVSKRVWTRSQPDLDGALERCLRYDKCIGVVKNNNGKVRCVYMMNDVKSTRVYYDTRSSPSQAVDPSEIHITSSNASGWTMYVKRNYDNQVKVLSASSSLSLCNVFPYDGSEFLIRVKRNNSYFMHKYKSGLQGTVAQNACDAAKFKINNGSLQYHKNDQWHNLGFLVQNGGSFKYSTHGNTYIDVDFVKINGCHPGDYKKIQGVNDKCWGVNGIDVSLVDCTDSNVGKFNLHDSNIYEYSTGKCVGSNMTYQTCSSNGEWHHDSNLLKWGAQHAAKAADSEVQFVDNIAECGPDKAPYLWEFGTAPPAPDDCAPVFVAGNTAENVDTVDMDSLQKFTYTDYDSQGAAQEACANDSNCIGVYGPGVGGKWSTLTPQNITNKYYTRPGQKTMILKKDMGWIIQMPWFPPDNGFKLQKYKSNGGWEYTYMSKKTRYEKDDVGNGDRVRETRKLNAAAMLVLEYAGGNNFFVREKNKNLYLIESNGELIWSDNKNNGRFKIVNYGSGKYRLLTSNGKCIEFNDWKASIKNCNANSGKHRIAIS